MVDQLSMALNRPLVVRRGWPGFIETNSINAYVGEWVVFKLPLNDTMSMEIRIPVDEALEQGIVIEAERLEFTPEDFEEETLGDND